MGRFAEKVRRGKVIGPRRRAFTLDSWREAFEKLSSKDSVDIALYTSGQHIHSKLGAVRDAIAQSSLSRLSTETRVKAFVAAANHQFEAIELQLKSRATDVAASAGSPREVGVGELAASQIKLADDEEWNPDAVLSSMLDGITIPIRVDLMDPPVVADDGFSDVDWNDVIRETNLGTLYIQAESLWEDCIWNTYFVEKGSSERTLLAIPINPNAKRGFLASRLRKVSLVFEATFYSHRASTQAEILGLPPRIREIREVLTDGDQQRINVGAHEIDRNTQTTLLALKHMACPPYYDSLVQEPQTLLTGLSLSQLIDGWVVVSQAAKRLYEAALPAREINDHEKAREQSDMREYIPFFTKNALIAAVHEATGIPVEGAEAIIDFLTFRGEEKQQFWTQPLVSAGTPSKLYPIFGAIVAPPNLRYVLECWMAQLNVKLEDRGPAFEEYLRNRLMEAASTSPMLSTITRVVPQDYTFRCTDGFGQIDALFCIGPRVFVLEAKCILEPTESTSIGTHRVALEHAVEQARERVSLIEDHRAEFIMEMKRFDWNLQPEFSVYPLVAVSTADHVGTPLNGVAIVDEFILTKFFQGGYDRVGLSGGDFSVVQRVHHPFYTTAAEAQTCVPQYFEHPPQLDQYNAALQPRLIPMYAVTEHDWFGRILDFE